MSAEHLYSQLVGELECPVCLETCTPPIYVCKNGHGVCHKCQPKLKACSTCRTKGKPKSRCIQLEKIAALVKVPCTGCNLPFNAAEMAQHLPTSGHGFRCQLCSEWTGSSQGMSDHVRRKHGHNYVKLPEGGSSRMGLGEAVWNDKRAYFDLIAFNDDVFWLETKYASETRVFLRTLRIVSHDDGAASGYRYSQTIKWRGHVPKCRLDHEAGVLKEGDARIDEMGIVLPVGMIAASRSGKVKCTFKISVRDGVAGEGGNFGPDRAGHSSSARYQPY